MKTDSRIAHRSAESNAAWLTFWIRLGEAVKSRYASAPICDACDGRGYISRTAESELFGGVYGTSVEQCRACKGTGKR